MLKPRVLVVDDDEGVRYTLREILESSGLEVDVACDGVEALERLQLQPAQLVVTDLRMPRMDGMELLRKLMAQNPAPRVVVITAMVRNVRQSMPSRLARSTTSANHSRPTSWSR